MNPTTPNSTVREMDWRTNDHIEVRLLCNSLTDSVSVSLHDARSGESFRFDAAPAHALEAFATHSPTPATTTTPGHDGPSIYPPASREEGTNGDQHSPHLSSGSRADR